MIPIWISQKQIAKTKTSICEKTKQTLRNHDSSAPVRMNEIVFFYLYLLYSTSVHSCENVDQGIWFQTFIDSFFLFWFNQKTWSSVSRIFRADDGTRTKSLFWPDCGHPSCQGGSEILRQWEKVLTPTAMLTFSYFWAIIDVSLIHRLAAVCLPSGSSVLHPVCTSAVLAGGPLRIISKVEKLVSSFCPCRQLQLLLLSFSCRFWGIRLPSVRIHVSGLVFSLPGRRLQTPLWGTERLKGQRRTREGQPAETLLLFCVCGPEKSL